MTEREDPEAGVPIPDSEIIEAVNRGTLVLFVGAGVSRLVGCEGWDDLAADLLRLCYEKKFITHRAFKELKSLTDHRQLMTICYHMLNDHNEAKLFYHKLRSALTPNSKKKRFMDVFDRLSRMQQFCIVTTNADKNLDRCFDERRIVSKAEDFPSKPRSGFLYHLHGSVSDIENVVFTLEQYFEQYKGSTRSHIPAFLEYLFSECNILFLGYGLSEFEILEFIFRQPETTPRHPHRHFMLIDDSADGFRKSYLQTYYDDMRIRLISYNTDIRGYDELYYVIRSWSRQLAPAQRYANLPDEQERLRQVATQAYDQTTMEDIRDLLLRSDLEAFFFNILSNSTDEICWSWLRPLDENRCFSPEDHPSMKETRGSSEGAFWNPFAYLDRMAAFAIKTQDVEVAEVLAGIAAKLARFSIEKSDKQYDLRTASFILRGLLTSKRVLADPGLRKAALALMTTLSTSILLVITVSEELICFLIKQGNSIALRMILGVCLRSLSNKEDEHAQREVTWEFENVVLPHAAELVSVCSPNVAQMGVGALRNWQRESGFDRTDYWVPSIEESDQNKDQAFSAPMAIVRFTRLACDEMSPEHRKDLVERLLVSRASILRRMGYYLVDRHYGGVSAAFWSSRRNALLDVDAFHEVYMLLSTHTHEMNHEQVGVLLGWLEEAGSKWGRQDGGDRTTRDARGIRFKAKWLLSVETSIDARIQDLVKENWSGRPRPTCPEWSFHIGPAVRDTTGIVAVERLQAFETNEELAAFLNATDMSDIYSAIRELVSGDPERLIRNGLQDLSGIPLDCLQAIFQGFASAIQNKEPFQVLPVFRLGESMLTRLREYSAEDAAREDRRGACEAVCDFVSVVASNQVGRWTGDEIDLIPKLLQEATEVASRYPVTDPALTKPRWRAVNSALAAALKATILVAWSLAGAKNSGTRHLQRIPGWANELLEIALAYTDPAADTEAREGIAVGLYLLNILDPSWVSDHLDQIFPQESTDRWIDAFSAYLMSSRVYQELFLLLRERGEYSFALAMRFSEEETEKSLASHVCLAYVYDLDDGLMDQMLDDGEEIRIGEVVWYFANRQREWTDPRREKLMQLWPKMIKAISRVAGSSTRTKLLSALPEWLYAFQKLPASVEDLLEKSFDNWDLHVTGGLEILESLARFVDSDAERVGNVLLTALKKDVVLSYATEVLVKIAETLCQKGFVSKAAEIHAEYSKKGVYAMGPVLKKWRKP